MLTKMKLGDENLWLAVAQHLCDPSRRVWIWRGSERYINSAKRKGGQHGNNLIDRSLKKMNDKMTCSDAESVRQYLSKSIHPFSERDPAQLSTRVLLSIVAIVVKGL